VRRDVAGQDIDAAMSGAGGIVVTGTSDVLIHAPVDTGEQCVSSSD